MSTESGNIGAKHDLKGRQGARLHRTITVNRDLTGYVVTAQARRETGSTSAVDFACTEPVWDGEFSTFEILLTPEQTAAMTSMSPSWVYDLVITKDEGPIPYLFGPLKFRPSVTR